MEQHICILVIVVSVLVAVLLTLYLKKCKCKSAQGSMLPLPGDKFGFTYYIDSIINDGGGGERFLASMGDVKAVIGDHGNILTGNPKIKIGGFPNATAIQLSSSNRIDGDVFGPIKLNKWVKKDGTLFGVYQDPQNRWITVQAPGSWINSVSEGDSVYITFLNQNDTPWP